jgi:hypothetical protein
MHEDEISCPVAEDWSRIEAADGNKSVDKAEEEEWEQQNFSRDVSPPNVVSSSKFGSKELYQRQYPQNHEWWDH